MAPNRKIECDDRVRGAKRRVDVTIFLVHDCGLGSPPGREFARFLIGPQQRRQLLRVDLNKIRGIFRHVGIISKHGSHRLTHITQTIGGEDMLAIRLESVDAAEAKIDRRNVSDICSGPHRIYARERARLPGIDRGQPRVRVGGADDAHVQLVGKRNIGCEAAGAAEQWRIFEPRYRAPDELSAHADPVLRACRMSCATARTALMMF